MTNLFSTSLIRNIYKKPSKKSEVTSQIIYGEKIRILKFTERWLKIKTYNDNYSGYIKNEKLKEGLKIIFKTNKLKTRIFSQNKKKNFLTFNSRLPIINKRKKFIEFEKGKWVKRADIKPINHRDSNFFKILKSFKKGKKKLIKFSKGDIIYWKGHVAVCLDRNKLIHAYGPRKKVLIMNIKRTIELINKTAKLKVKKIIRI